MVVLALTLLAPAHAGDVYRADDVAPPRRVADVGLTFPGIPDLLGVRVAAYPTPHLSLELGAHTMLFLSSLSATAAWRFDLPDHERWSIGPALGARRMVALCFDACPDPTNRVDALVEADFTHWVTPHLGLDLRVDAGASVDVLVLDPARANLPSAPVIPVLRFGFGLAL